jgi:hypothetical protein
VQPLSSFFEKGQGGSGQSVERLPTVKASIALNSEGLPPLFDILRIAINTISRCCKPIFDDRDNMFKIIFSIKSLLEELALLNRKVVNEGHNFLKIVFVHAASKFATV